LLPRELHIKKTEGLLMNLGSQTFLFRETILNTYTIAQPACTTGGGRVGGERRGEEKGRREEGRGGRGGEGIILAVVILGLNLLTLLSITNPHILNPKRCVEHPCRF